MAVGCRLWAVARNRSRFGFSTRASNSQRSPASDSQSRSRFFSTYSLEPTASFGRRHIRNPDLNTDVWGVAEVRDVFGYREAPQHVSPARLQSQAQLIFLLRELFDVGVLNDAAACVSLQNHTRALAEPEAVADDQRRDDLRFVGGDFRAARVVDGASR